MLDLNSLNDAQQKAVMHGSGPLLVLAGPGSGKTFTITQRICYLIEREFVPPEQILVITFTRDAALSMQNRFLSLSERVFPVSFGTFHSVFYHILKQSHVLCSEKILTEAQKKNLMIPILKKYVSGEEAAHRQNDFTEDAVSLLSALSYYKNTEDCEGAKSSLPEEWQPYFETITEEFEQERKRGRALDFDDMVCECRRLLQQNGKARAYWQSRFSHILIDEFQDINPVQYEVIRLLSPPPHHLFAVGDDDQSIYGFRGAKPACLKRFAEEYHARQICLDVNYRSSQQIIDAALSVIEENQERFPKRLRAAREAAGNQNSAAPEAAVQLKSFTGREDQMQYLTGRVRKLCEKPDGEQETKEQGTGGQEAKQTVGVLFRTNSYMQSFAAMLNREGIPFAMKEKSAGIYEHFIVKDVMAYLWLAHGKGSRALFLQVMNRPSRYISRDALGRGTPDFQELIRFYRENGTSVRRDSVIHALERWERQMEQLGRLSPYLAVQFVRRVIGYETYLKEKAGKKGERLQEWEELLDWLADDAAHYENMEDWQKAQESLSKQEGTREDCTVSLMTVHGSKGLEFDQVFIPDCNEKIFPHGGLTDRAACEEERRIFYVAMTRAKKSLELLYLVGTKERPKLPSRFLNPLLQIRDHSSISSSNSQPSRYSSKASATFSYSSSSSIKPSSGSSFGSSGFS